MAAWALSVLGAQTPELWAAELSFIAACPPDSLDEASGRGVPGAAGRRGMPGWMRRAALRLFKVGCSTPPSLPPQVALIHLWQAGMFTDRAAVAAPTAAEHAPRMRSAAGGRGSQQRSWAAACRGQSGGGPSSGGMFPHASSILSYPLLPPPQTRCAPRWRRAAAPSRWPAGPRPPTAPPRSRPALTGR